MPKQRNHPHHHRRASRASGGLELPESPRFTHFWTAATRYPIGWATRPAPASVARLYLFAGALVVALFALLVAGAALVTLAQTLVGGR